MLQFFSNLADFIGILAFAFSGLLAGKERRLDPVGILFSRSRRRSEAEFFVTW